FGWQFALGPGGRVLLRCGGPRGVRLARRGPRGWVRGAGLREGIHIQQGCDGDNNSTNCKFIHLSPGILMWFFSLDSGCNGKATALAKCLRTDLQYRRSLLPLVFAALNHLYDPLYRLEIKSTLARNLIDGFIILYVIFEDTVEDFIWRQSIDILLV